MSDENSERACLIEIPDLNAYRLTISSGINISADLVEFGIGWVAVFMLLLVEGRVPIQKGIKV